MTSKEKEGNKAWKRRFFLKGGEADLLSRVLEKVKSTALEESEISLSDMEALELLASCFENAEKEKPEREAPQVTEKPECKLLFLGHYIGRQALTDAANGSQG